MSTGSRAAGMVRPPPAFPNMQIGLLGGSFNPAHEGHRHISQVALKRLGLDRVWWLVTPGNPLNPRHDLKPLDRRIAEARRVAAHPRITVTGFEAARRDAYTVNTLRFLQSRFPATRFVWLMGADSLADLDRWQNWRWIMENVPVGVMARPGQRISARMSKAAYVYRRWRLRGPRSELLAKGAPPRWAFVNVPMNAASSSAIRARGEWE